LLKTAEAKALTLCSADSHIGAVVEQVDVFIAIAGILRSNHETITKHIGGSTLQLDLPSKIVN
jgi:hypothetical protein